VAHPRPSGARRIFSTITSAFDPRVVQFALKMLL
jgi:hypothetical protein